MPSKRLAAGETCVTAAGGVASGGTFAPNAVAPGGPPPVPASGMSEIDERIAAIQAEREALFEQRKPIDDRIRQLYDELQAARDEKAKSLTVVDAASLHQMFDLGWSGGAGNATAGQKLDAHVAPLGVTRDLGGGWHHVGEHGEGGSYRALGIALNRGQDTEALAASYEEYDRQVAEAMDIDTVHFGIMDHTLSANGSHAVEYTPSTGRALLRVMRYGRRKDLFEGTMPEVVERIARDHWYEDPNGSSSGYDDDDQDW